MSNVEDSSAASAAESNGVGYTTNRQIFPAWNVEIQYPGPVPAEVWQVTTDTFRGSIGTKTPLGSDLLNLICVNEDIHKGSYLVKIDWDKHRLYACPSDGTSAPSGLEDTADVDILTIDVDGTGYKEESIVVHTQNGRENPLTRVVRFDNHISQGSVGKPVSQSVSHPGSDQAGSENPSS